MTKTLPSSVPTAVSAPSAADEHYRLGPGDKLKITIYGEEDLSGEYVVNGSGQVQLPLVGQVKAAGLTLQDFVGEVTTAFEAGYLKNPKISVEVANFRPFFIMGEVNRPGQYPYESGLTIMGAIALAGGYTYRASDSSVYVRHSNGGEEEAIPTNVPAKVSPGDIIRVPERLF